MTDDDLAYASIAQVGALLRRRELSPVELLDATRRRVERLGERLNCFISLRWDRAREEARAAEERLARGAPAGPLDGIPIALKDNIAIAGEVTTAGSGALADWVPSATAPVVERLWAAGAVVIGKNNLYELAYGAPHPRFGPTRNPWALEHSCAGSSSGSAAAVAAGLCYGALGTDTGCSIRVPAAFCGVVGVKPTYGRVSLDGVVPVSVNLDHVGPMTRTVEDAALLLDAMTGSKAELAGGVEGVTIGLPRRQDHERLAAEVAEAVAGAAAALEAAGARLERVALPDLATAGTAMWAISAAEAAEYHHRTLRERPEVLHPKVRALIEGGESIPACAYVRAQRVRARMTREVEDVLRRVDAILLPAAAFPAYEIGAETVAFDGVEEDVLAGITRYAPLFNLTGHPALSLPCGFTDDGRPLGVQLVGRPFGEAALFRVAHVYEQAAGWHERRPSL